MAPTFVDMRRECDAGRGLVPRGGGAGAGRGLGMRIFRSLFV